MQNLDFAKSASRKKNINVIKVPHTNPFEWLTMGYMQVQSEWGLLILLLIKKLGWSFCFRHFYENWLSFSYMAGIFYSVNQSLFWRLQMKIQTILHMWQGSCFIWIIFALSRGMLLSKIEIIKNKNSIGVPRPSESRGMPQGPLTLIETVEMLSHM